MAQVRFTEKLVRRLKAPDPSGKQVLYWDEAMPGFGILCSGTSAIKTYVARGTVRGRDIRKVIARADLISLADARDRAREMMVGFAGGVDPRAIKTSSDGVTLRQALDSYLALKNLKPRSKEECRAIVERHLANWLDVPLWSISRGMVEQRHKAIAQEVEQRHRDKAKQDAMRHLRRAERTETSWPEASAAHRAKYDTAKGRQPNKGHATANGAVTALRAIWNFMTDRVDGPDDPPRNPVRLKGQWYSVKERERHLRDGELPAFYHATMALANPIARDYILLLLFTGLRRREASSLRWKEDIDLPGGIIHISASATKASRKLDLPMSDVVHDLLVARRAIGDAKYAFPAGSGSGHIEEPKFYFQQIADTTGIRISVHDLRRTFVTIAESCDTPAFALAALVNHSLGRGVTPKYIQMSAERLREPVQRVADRIKELCGVQEPEGANVAKLR